MPAEHHPVPARQAASTRDEMFTQLYAELKLCAARHLRRERQGHTLRTTALVHEIYCRLFEPQRDQWSSDASFMALASTAMRRVLIDYARARHAGKRGSGWQRSGVDVEALISEEQGQELIALDEALAQLESFDQRQARLIELRFFGGYTIEEAARVLEVSVATAKREWAMARAWLHREVRTRLEFPD